MFVPSNRISTIHYTSSEWSWSCCDCHEEIYVPVALKEKQHGSTTWETPVNCQRGGRDRHRREDRGALPSKGVRLEPPFFPSSPCCEYCFRRFWALRMVPGPINTETESRGGGGGARSRQPRKEGRTKKKKKKKGELGSEWWNTDTTTETGSRGLYVAEEGDSLAPQLQQQDARERDGVTTATSWKNTSERVCSDARRPEWCESRMNRLGQFKHKNSHQLKQLTVISSNNITNITTTCCYTV